MTYQKGKEQIAAAKDAAIDAKIKAYEDARSELDRAQPNAANRETLQAKVTITRKELTRALDPKNDVHQKFKLGIQYEEAKTRLGTNADIKSQTEAYEAELAAPMADQNPRPTVAANRLTDTAKARREAAQEFLTAHDKVRELDGKLVDQVYSEKLDAMQVAKKDFLAAKKAADGLDPKSETFETSMKDLRQKENAFLRSKAALKDADTDQSYGYQKYAAYMKAKQAHSPFMKQEREAIDAFNNQTNTLNAARMNATYQSIQMIFSGSQAINAIFGQGGAQMANAAGSYSQAIGQAAASELQTEAKTKEYQAGDQEKLRDEVKKVVDQATNLLSPDHYESRRNDPADRSESVKAVSRKKRRAKKCPLLIDPSTLLRALSLLPWKDSISRRSTVGESDSASPDIHSPGPNLKPIKKPGIIKRFLATVFPCLFRRFRLECGMAYFNQHLANTVRLLHGLSADSKQGDFRRSVALQTLAEQCRVMWNDASWAEEDRNKFTEKVQDGLLQYLTAVETGLDNSGILEMLSSLRTDLWGDEQGPSDLPAGLKNRYRNDPIVQVLLGSGRNEKSTVETRLEDIVVPNRGAGLIGLLDEPLISPVRRQPLTTKQLGDQIASELFPALIQFSIDKNAAIVVIQSAISKLVKDSRATYPEKTDADIARQLADIVEERCRGLVDAVGTNLRLNAKNVLEHMEAKETKTQWTDPMATSALAISLLTHVSCSLSEPKLNPKASAENKMESEDEQWPSDSEDATAKDVAKKAPKKTLEEAPQSVSQNRRLYDVPSGR